MSSERRDGEGTRTGGPLGYLAAVSEAQVIERTTGTVEAVGGLIQRALTAIENDDRDRARALLDRATGLLPTEGDDVPDILRNLMAEFGSQIARVRALADLPAD